MARIRTVKPDFFRHYGLYKAEQETSFPLRVAFAGLWTAADREGRFRWKAEALKLDCLPYDNLDFSRVLDALMTRGFIEQYTVGNEVYGWIPSFLKHQVINNRERPSELPNPLDTTISTRGPRVSDAWTVPLCNAQGEVEVEGKGNHASLTRVEEPSKKAGRRSRAVPSSFVISDQLKRWAMETRPDLDIDLEIEKFRDHEFKDPKTNWEGVFRNWIRNARSEPKNNGCGKLYKPDTVGEPPPAAGPMDPEYEKLVSEKAEELFGRLEF